MGQLAMGPVDLAPLLEQGQNLGVFIGQDALDRAPAGRGVDQPATSPAAVPAMRTDLAELEDPAGAAMVQPASTDSSIKSSSPALVAASTLRGTRPLSPNRLFPPPA